MGQLQHLSCLTLAFVHCWGLASTSCEAVLWQGSHLGPNEKQSHMREVMLLGMRVAAP